jgi:hypothetical protein
MEAAIVFCRAALHRLQIQTSSRLGAWWAGLRNDPDLDFIRQRRDWIVKQAPEKFNQVVRPNEPFEFAADSYYYEKYDIRATTTLRRCVDATGATSGTPTRNSVSHRRRVKAGQAPRRDQR